MGRRLERINLNVDMNTGTREREGEREKGVYIVLYEMSSRTV